MIWEDPPSQDGVHEALFDECRKHPGQWAVFTRGVKSPGGYMDKLSNGRYRGIKAGELEVRSHRTSRGTDVYIRFRGDT